MLPTFIFSEMGTYVRWDFCDNTSRVSFSFIGCTSNDVFPLTGLRHRYVLTAEMVRSTFITRGHQIPIRLGRSQLGQSHMETWGVFSERQRGQFSIRNRTKCIDSNTSERRNTLYSQVSNCTYSESTWSSFPCHRQYLLMYWYMSRRLIIELN